MHKNISFVGAITFFLLLSFSVSISGQTNRIMGFVFGPSRQPVSQAYVELLNDVNTVIYRTRTDNSGYYSFLGMAAGRYTIRVDPIGTSLARTNEGGQDLFEAMSQEVELVNIPTPGRLSSDMVQKDFYLRLRKRAGATEGMKPGVVFAQEIPKDARKFYERAMKSFEEGDAAGAAKNLDAALTIFPDYYDALDRVGREYIRLKKFAEAVPYLKRGSYINPKEPRIWYALAYATCNADLLADCVESSRKAAELAPGSADIALLHGIALRKAQRFDEAEKEMLRAKELAGNKNPDISWNLALLYERNMNRPLDAVKELEEFLRLSPQSPDTASIRKLIGALKQKAESTNK
jgi:tetratricopeptide (TPR) repeat protein